MSGTGATVATGGLVNDIRVLAGRNLRHALSGGQQVTSMIITPLLFLFVFLAVFRKLLEARGVDYIQFLPAGIVIQTATWLGISSSFLLARDRGSGVLARIRAMPINAAAVPVARLLIDAVQALIPALIIVGVAHIFGFRFHDVVAGVVFVALAVLTTLAFAVVTALLGLSARDPAAVSSGLILPFLALLALSTAFVPADSFPGWLEPIVRASPISVVADAMRDTAAHGPSFSGLWPALAWLTGLIVVFGWAAARAFRRAT
jgi:ABC-2 type transport system permease protein